MTNQGHNDDSTWSRGQAWAILGFAQTYTWTKDTRYLKTAINCAKYFLSRCDEGKTKWDHTLVPVWDFDAHHENEQKPLRDVSAGVIAANGLLIIHQALQALSAVEVGTLMDSKTDFLQLAVQIVGETLDMALDRDYAKIVTPDLTAVNGDTIHKPAIKLENSAFEAILRHSTSNNNEHAHQPYQDHGLVYADYFLLEFGNKLLRMGYV